ncbi:enolase C-terminal domain-like protein [Fusarium oxysporum II5]|nr:enolase C-terminal domain-like protein [Fusarium oxysporum II5]
MMARIPCLVVVVRSSTSGQPSIVIRIRTTGAPPIEGWAKTAPLGSNYLPSSFAAEIAALKELGPLVIGRDPRSPAAIDVVMDRAMMAGTAAKAVINMACWDILGKATGLPTSALLGGSLTKNPPGFCVINFGDPETGVKDALAEAEKGFKFMQIKAGAVDPLSDAGRVKAIRKALPESVTAWADVNAGWNLDQALTYARALGQDITVPLEQPCRLTSHCAEVGRRTDLPIVMDEGIVIMLDLITAHAAGVTAINIKPSRVGGFTKARTLRDAAIALDIKVNIDDTWGCALTTAQNMQLAASTPPDRLRAVDLFTEWISPMIADVPRMQSDGRVDYTVLPGNGFGSVNLDMLGEPLFQVTG